MHSLTPDGANTGAALAENVSIISIDSRAVCFSQTCQQFLFTVTVPLLMLVIFNNEFALPKEKKHPIPALYFSNK